METIFHNDRIELTYKPRERGYVLSIYDVYGHYVDDIEMSEAEIKELSEGLNKARG